MKPRRTFRPIPGGDIAVGPGKVQQPAAATMGARVRYMQFKSLQLNTIST